jgi:hypothetical protein
MNGIRPRFGWTDTLDEDPQYIYEEKSDDHPYPVVVIPLPYMSPKLRRLIREYTNSIWPSVRSRTA